MNKKFDIHIWEYNLALFLRAAILLSPVMLLFYQENGLSVQDLFFFQGIFYLTSIIMEFPAGYLSDLISRKQVMLISFVIFLGINFMWLFGHGYFVILLGEILFGVSKVLMDNAVSGYLYDYLITKNNNAGMAKYYGYLNFYLAMGTACAALFGTWLYVKFGSPVVLKTEILIMFISIALICSMPTIKNSKDKSNTLREKILEFKQTTVNIYQKDEIKYFIFYSGLLTAVSILFALSFQPLMQNAMVPVALFGLAAFFNHGIRALSGAIVGNRQGNFNIHKMIIPLYALYIAAFGLIFEILFCKNTAVVISLIFAICLVIGAQLIFTILHISRLHKFVTTNERGSLIAVNNFVSRSLAALALVCSKFFLYKTGMVSFYIFAFVIFVISGGYIVSKILKNGERV